MRVLLRLALASTLIILVSLAWTGCARVVGPAQEDVDEKGPEPEIRFIVISSGTPGGVYAPLGTGIAKIISDKVPGVFGQSRTTAGSVENIRSVGKGESDMGMAMGNVAYDAYTGVGAFEGDHQPLRALFSMYPSPQHLVVLKEAEINSIADLVGKRVSVDAAGSGCEIISHIVLEAAGIRDRVTTVNYLTRDAAEALKEGTIDAAFYNFAFPGLVIEEILETHSIRLIPLEDELLDAIVSQNPYFFKGTIPKRTYKGVTDEIQVLVVSNVMVGHENMNADLVYQIVKALYEESSLKQLASIHRAGKQFALSTAVQSPIPLHPGAEGFFEEVGAGSAE